MKPNEKNLHHFPDFWVNVGWDLPEAKLIVLACDPHALRVREWYREHPKACLCEKHPMYWYGKGHDLTEAITLAYEAAKANGPVTTVEYLRIDRSAKPPVKKWNRHRKKLERGLAEFSLERDDYLKEIREGQLAKKQPLQDCDAAGILECLLYPIRSWTALRWLCPRLNSWAPPPNPSYYDLAWLDVPVCEGLTEPESITGNTSKNVQRIYADRPNGWLASWQRQARFRSRSDREYLWSCEKWVKANLRVKIGENVNYDGLDYDNEEFDLNDAPRLEIGNGLAKHPSESKGPHTAGTPFRPRYCPRFVGGRPVSSLTRPLWHLYDTLTSDAAQIVYALLLGISIFAVIPHNDANVSVQDVRHAPRLAASAGLSFLLGLVMLWEWVTTQRRLPPAKRWSWWGVLEFIRCIAVMGIALVLLFSCAVSWFR